MYSVFTREDTLQGWTYCFSTDSHFKAGALVLILQKATNWQFDIRKTV